VGEVRDGHGGVDGKFPNYIKIISEDGTASMGVQGHMWPKAWTYRSYDPKTRQEIDFLSEYNKNPDTAMIPTLTPDGKEWLTRRVGRMFSNRLGNTMQSGLSGSFYCQIVDTETECDGLMSYDRAVPKVDAKAVAARIRGTLPKWSAGGNGHAAGWIPSRKLQYVFGNSSTDKGLWNYTTTATPPGPDWYKPGYDASHWKTGQGAFGTSAPDGVPVRTPWPDSPGDLWVRRTITLPASMSGEPVLMVYHDEDVEIYVNGILACKEEGFNDTYEDIDISAAALDQFKPGAKILIAAHVRQTGGGQGLDIGIAQVVH